MTWIIDLYVILIGLLLGSFYNVVALRALSKQSIVFPPSHCFHCKQPLRWYNLIPFFSFLLQRGKCSHCNARISFLYPIGEVVTATTFYLSYLHWGWTVELIMAWLLFSLLSIALITDLKAKLILDKFTIPAVLLFLLLRVFIGDESFLFYLSGAATGLFTLLVIGLISKGGMGGGDIKLYAAIGAVLGPWLTLFSFVLAACVGAVIGILMIALRVWHRKQMIPFGPYIVVGTCIAYLYGPAIWEWYRLLL